MMLVFIRNYGVRRVKIRNIRLMTNESGCDDDNDDDNDDDDDDDDDRWRSVIIRILMMTIMATIPLIVSNELWWRRRRTMDREEEEKDVAANVGAIRDRCRCRRCFCLKPLPPSLMGKPFKILERKKKHLNVVVFLVVVNIGAWERTVTPFHLKKSIPCRYLLRSYCFFLFTYHT